MMGKKHPLLLVFRSLFEDKTGGFSILTGSLRKLGSEVEKTSRKFQKLADKPRGLKKSLDGVQKSLSGIEQTSRGIGDVLGVSGLFAGIGGALSLKVAADFEEELFKLQEVVKSTEHSLDALTGKPRRITLTTEDFAMLKEEAQRLGGTTQFSPVQVAQGMKLLGAGGWGAQEVKDSIAPVMYLTGAAQIKSPIELPEVAESFSSVLAAFGIPSAQAPAFGDQLAYAFSNSQQTYGELMDALRIFAPIAKSSGVDPQSAIAIVMSLAELGTKDSVAGTALAGLTGRVLNLTPDSKKALVESKIPAKEYTKFYDPKAQTIRDLPKLFDLFARYHVKTGQMMRILGQESGKYTIGLADTKVVAAIRERSSVLTQGTKGTAQRLNDSNVKGFAGHMRLLESALEDLAIKVGEAGLLTALTAVTVQITELTNALGTIPPGVLRPVALLVTGLGGLVSALVGLRLAQRVGQFLGITRMLPSVLPRALPNLPDISFAAIGKLFTGIWSLGKLVVRFVRPLISICRLVLSINGIIYSVVTYLAWFAYKNWANLKKSLPILHVFEDDFKRFSSWVPETIAAIRDFITSLWSTISEKSYTLGQWLKEKFLNFVDPKQENSWQFDPFAASSEQQHARFESHAPKPAGTDKPLAARIKVDFSNLPRRSRVEVERTPGLVIDTYTGFAWEGIG